MEKRTFWDNFTKPRWKWVSILPILYGWFAFIRDEFLPIELAEKLRIGGIMGLIDWYWWVIGGFAFLFFATVFSRSDLRKDKARKIDTKKIALADDFFRIQPDHDYTKTTIDEYVFTLINGTGQDLKRCFVLLSEVAVKNERVSEKWIIEAKNIFSKPFRWYENNVYLDGKLDIEEGDRASFVVIASAFHPIMTKHGSEYWNDFYLTFYNDANVTSFSSNGNEHRLLLEIMGRDTNNDVIPSVKYYAFFKTNYSAHPGISDIKVIRCE